VWATQAQKAENDGIELIRDLVNLTKVLVVLSLLSKELWAALACGYSGCVLSDCTGYGLTTLM